MSDRSVVETWIFSISELLHRSRRDIHIKLVFVDEYLSNISIRSEISTAYTSGDVEFTVECRDGDEYAGLCMDLALDLAERIINEKGADSVKREVKINETWTVHHTY